VVLIDADSEDANLFAASIEAAVMKVAPDLSVLVRIAVEETEAFYLGDLAGLKEAFLGADMAAARAYVPDSICGTAELFGNSRRWWENLSRLGRGDGASADQRRSDLRRSNC